MSLTCGIGEAMNSFSYQIQDDPVIRIMKYKLDYLLTKRVETVSAISDDLDKAEEVLEVRKNGD